MEIVDLTLPGSPHMYPYVGAVAVFLHNVPPPLQEKLGIDAKIVPSSMAGLREQIVLRQLKNRFPGGNPGPTAGGWYVRLSVESSRTCVWIEYPHSTPPL